MSPEGLRERLGRLQKEGISHFDAIGMSFIEALLSRAETAGGGAGERLFARVEERLDRIEAAFVAAREQAARALAEFEEAGGEVPSELEQALARGEFDIVRQSARRRLNELVRGRARIRIPYLPRLAREALERDIKPIEDLAQSLAAMAGEDGLIERRQLGRALLFSSALSRALLRESLERARAPLALARAADNVPEAAGPYNPQALAARALAAVSELSPSYLRAFVAMLDDLAALDAAAEPAPRKGKSPRRKKSGAVAS